MLLIAATLALAPGLQSDVFAGDQRLAQSISYRTDCSTMSASLAEFSKTLNVKLEVAKDIEDDLLILRSADTPARETLNVIANHFGWQWKKTDDGYQLYRSAEAKKAEEKALREQILKPYHQVRDAALMSLKGSIDEKAVNEYQTVSTKLFDLLKQPGGYDQDYRDLSKRNYELERQVSPRRRLEEAVFASLSDEQYLELDDVGRLVFSSSPTSMQRPMPKGALPYLQQFIEATLQYRMGSDPQSAAQRKMFGIAMLGSVAVEDLGAVRIAIIRQFPADVFLPAPNVGYEVSLIRADGAFLGFRTDDTVGGFSLDELPELSKDNKSGLTKDISASKEIVELDAANALGDIAAYQEALDEFWHKRSTAHPDLSFGHLVNATASESGANAIADSYGYKQINRPIPTVSARAALDAICSRVHADWEIASKWLRIKSTDRALQRAATVPCSTLFRFRDRCMTEGPSIELLSDVASSLTDRQLSSVLAHQMTQGAITPFGFRTGQGGLSLLRLWHELGIATKVQLKKGATLQVFGLSQAARTYYFKALQRSENSGDIPLDDDAGYFETPEDSNWARQNWPERSFDDRHTFDDEITQLLPNGLPLDAQLSAHYATNPGFIQTSLGSTGSAVDDKQAALGIIYSRKGLQYYPHGNLMPAMREHLFFTLFPTPRVAKASIVTGSTIAPGSSFCTFDNLPPAIKNRLQKVIEKYSK